MSQSLLGSLLLMPYAIKAKLFQSPFRRKMKSYLSSAIFKSKISYPESKFSHKNSPLTPGRTIHQSSSHPLPFLWARLGFRKHDCSEWPRHPCRATSWTCSAEGRILKVYITARWIRENYSGFHCRTSRTSDYMSRLKR